MTLAITGTTMVPAIDQTRPSLGLASGFALPQTLQDAPPARASTGVLAPAAPSAAGMLALQEQVSAQERDREGRRRGEELAATLIRLQREMLGEPGAGDSLQRLASLTEFLPHCADSRLAEALRALVLRARLELARRRL